MCIAHYYIPLALRDEFKNFAYRLCKSASEALIQAMEEFMERHAQEAQPIVINYNQYNLTNIKIDNIINLTNKAKVKNIIQEIEHLLNLLERVKDEESRKEFYHKLMKKLEKAGKIYQETKDEELAEAIEKCKKYVEPILF